MTKFHTIYIIATTILIFLNSCNNKKIIEKDKFIDILTDIHTASGLIEFKQLQMQNRKTDSISLYNYVLKKHNISREDFNNTIEYYAEHNEEYLNIYKEVTKILEAKEKQLAEKVKYDKQKKLEKRKQKTKKGNLLNIKNKWELPKDGKKNPIPFSVKTNKHGTYILKADIKLYPDDKSVNPRMTIIANYSDGSRDLNSNGTMVKDGKFETFDVSIETNKNKKLVSISGWLLDHSNGTEKKHAEIKNISLTKTNETKKIHIK